MKIQTLLFLLAIGAAPVRGAGIPELMTRLKSADVAERRMASDALGQLGEKAFDAKSVIISALKDPDIMVRANAAWALGKIGSPDVEIIRGLITGLGDSDWTVRHNAALSLVKTGDVAVEPLAAMLDGGRGWQRLYAADTLTRLDRRKWKVTSPVIVEVLRAGDTEMTVLALGTLLYLGKDAADVAAELTPLVVSESKIIRSLAISIAGTIGQEARDAVKPIVGLIKTEKDDAIRGASYSTLASIGEPVEVVISALLAGLEDKKDRPRASAVEALARMGSPAVDPLLNSIREGRATLDAIDALALMGPRAKPAVPALVRLIDGEDWILRLRVAGALGSIGETDPEVLSVLKKAAKDPHESVRSHAEVALARLQGR